MLSLGQFKGLGLRAYTRIKVNSLYLRRVQHTGCGVERGLRICRDVTRNTTRPQGPFLRGNPFTTELIKGSRFGASAEGLWWHGIESGNCLNTPQVITTEV